MRENSGTSPFKITICGIDELVDHSDAKVTHVLSILDPATPEPEAFGAYGEHAKLELRFHDVIEATFPATTRRSRIISKPCWNSAAI